MEERRRLKLGLNICQTIVNVETRYLSAEDMKNMVYESTRNVVASVVSDSDYLDAGDDVSVSRLIEQELTREEVSSRQLRPHMWESVFWDPSWARPDKLTSYLNKALEQDANDTSSFVMTAQANSQVVYT